MYHKSPQMHFPSAYTGNTAGTARQALRYYRLATVW